MSKTDYNSDPHNLGGRVSASAIKPKAQGEIMNTDKHLPSAPLGAVEAEVRNALRELDSVTALDDDQSDGIGCAENALHRALDAIAHAEALLSFTEEAE